MPRRRRFSLAFVLVLSAPLAHAGTPGELWRITSKFEGMPISMPGQTQEICQPRGKQDERDMVLPKDGDCRITDHRAQGNKVSFKFRCDGEDKMSGSYESTRLGPDHHKGVMRMRMAGEPEEMVMAHEMKKLGACDYQAPKMPAGASVDLCQEHLKACSPYVFFTPAADGRLLADNDAICAKQRPAFCARIKGLGDRMGDPRLPKEEARVFQQGDMWKNAMLACKQDPDKALRAACTRAANSLNGEFLLHQCPEEAEAVALTYCQGRAYTHQSENMRNLCAELAPGGRDYTASRGYTASGRGGSRQQNSGDGGVVDSIQGGARKLFNFIGF